MMKVAVISDIHANRHAFEATLEAIADSSAAEVWCLGDLVGYGAEPDACVALARRHAAVCLAGNHDLAVTGDIALDEFSRGASLAAQWTREVISPENLAFLRTLSPQGEEGSVGLYHASPRDPVWEYVVSALLAELCMDAQPRRVCLIGHSHVALAFVRREGELTTGEPQRDGAELELRDGEWLLNPGSVGQPRDGDPRAGWLLLDTDGLTASYHRAAYDVAGAAAAIRAARLPDSLAERLEYGQ
jgi:predicted phosphodiesterase